MKASRGLVFLLFLFMIILVISCASNRQQLTGDSAKYSPNVPEKITTPDKVDTRIGTLHFKDGTPDPATVQLAYDQLDFGRGVDAFLRGMSATSVHALCSGFEEAGIKFNQGIGIAMDLLDARSLFLTPNTTTGSAYAGTFRDSAGNYLDGSRTYKATLPGRIPAKNGRGAV